MTRKYGPPRTLTREERALWDKVSRTVAQDAPQPTHDRMTYDAIDRALHPESTADHAGADARDGQKPGPQKRAVSSYVPRQLPSHLRTSASTGAYHRAGNKPSLMQAGDPRMDRNVRRGRIKIDAVIDLHGMTQIAAHERLKSFVTHARNRSFRVILVITGKGGDPLARGHRHDSHMAAPLSTGPADRHASAPRGVLRQRFADWVNESPLREQITRVSTAKQTDGGTGAFYVFLKSTRKGAPKP